MNKKVRGIISGLLCFVMLCTPVFANETDDLKAQLTDSVQKIKDLNSQVDTTKSTLADIEKEISQSNKAIEAINAEISVIDGQIASLDGRMAERKVQIAELEVKKAQQEKELEERLRVMYMYGNDGYLQALFSSDNITDFVARADMMKNIMKADKDAVTALETTQKDLVAQNASLEADKATAEQAKTAQSSAKTQQEGIKAQQDQLKAQNQAVIDKLKADIASEEQAAKDTIVALGSDAPNGVVQFGEYYWPIDPGNSQAYWISSPFAGRIHPITGEWSNHQGVDVAVSYGTPILAAGDGTITSAGWNGGYGECVVMNMGTDAAGNQLGTLYGHMSQVATTAGASVKKGDIIGYVGSTGNSTGPHLHFGWYLNGDFTDPLAYYSANWNYVE